MAETPERKRRLGVVVNPTAGKGRGARVGNDVVNRLFSEGYDVWNLSGNSATLALEHCKRAIADGLDALIVVGGDGMVHLGINAVAGTGVPLGIVAMGTGNDFAHVIGLPVHDTQETVEAMDLALAQGPAGIQSFDALQVTGLGLEGEETKHPEYVRYAAGALSCGIDAAINARANIMTRPRGSARYVLAALRELSIYDAWQYHLIIENARVEEADLPRLLAFPGITDGGPEADGVGRRLHWDSPGALVTAANGKQIGGGILVAPDALPNDGLIDLVIAGDVKRAGAAKLFPQMLGGGSHKDSDDVRIIQCSAVTVESGDGGRHLPATFADGEYLGTLPLRAQIMPGALKILVPPQEASASEPTSPE
ncbi:MAG: diacylglycerol kinase [Cellulomonadaceae bacterium]|nr:diacylglycerol kinase [Cellulomonadaceae bacterium]